MLLQINSLLSAELLPVLLNQGGGGAPVPLTVDTPVSVDDASISVDDTTYIP